MMLEIHIRDCIWQILLFAAVFAIIIYKTWKKNKDKDKYHKYR
jgi:hypothetical protein